MNALMESAMRNVHGTPSKREVTEQKMLEIEPPKPVETPVF